MNFLYHIAQLLFFTCFLIQQFIMETLKKQNQELRKAIESILQEIERQKELNSQHQNETQTLLKFNQRLLSIIENELNNKKDTCSLQPISQRSQRESDLIGPALNSLIKSRKLVARSQRGFDTHNSLVQQARKNNNKMNDVFKQKEGLKSSFDKSYDIDDFSERKLQFKSNSGGVSPAVDRIQAQAPKKAEAVKKTIKQSQQVKQEMNQQIADLKKFKNEGVRFYDDKIKEIKGLSSKLNTFKPSQQLKNITQKLSLSEGTSALLQKTIKRGETKK